MSDRLLDIHRELGLQRPQATLADVHEWAVARIDEMQQSLQGYDLCMQELGLAEERIVELKAKLTAEQKEGDYMAEGLGKACADLRYIKGIVEKGIGKHVPDDKSITDAILEYVKSLESALAAAQERERCLGKLILEAVQQFDQINMAHSAAYFMDEMNKITEGKP